MKIKQILSVVALFCAFNLSATTWYVKPTGSDAHIGTSWAQALKSLQNAIDSAAVGDEIWVAAGTYYPTKALAENQDPVWRTFKITKDIKIYGGFNGTETNLSDRDWEGNETILSGAQDALLHVVYTTLVSNACLVDGFIITGGDARLSSGVMTSLNRSGGGWYNDAYGVNSSPTIANCHFAGNAANAAGGAFLNNGVDGSSHVQFTGCLFSLNTAGVLGGAVYSEGNATMDFTECVFDGNSCNAGGALSANSNGGVSNMTFLRCDFFRNVATKDGGVISVQPVEGTNNTSFEQCNLKANEAGRFGVAVHVYSRDANTFTYMTNCVISGNISNAFNHGTQVIYNQRSGGVCQMDIKNCSIVSNYSGPVKSIEDVVTLTNCVVFYNWERGLSGVSANYCNLDFFDYGSLGTNNFRTFPTFQLLISYDASPTTWGDYHLNACSPEINKGTNTNAPAEDMDGNLRPAGLTTDIGAYERIMSATCKNVEAYLDANGIVTFPLGLAIVSSNGCGALTLTVDGQENLQFSCSDLGAHNYTVTVTDAVENQTTCQTTITVRDTIKPVVLCPSNTTRALDTNCKILLGSYNPNSSSDNCSVLSGNQSPSQNTILSGHNNITTVLLYRTDQSGNTGYCSFTVTLKDYSAPLVTCKNATANLNANGTVTLGTAAVFQSGSDNCGSVTPESVSPNFFDCNHLGANTVILTVNDSHGNTSTCSATVMIADAAPPTVSCKPYTALLNAAGSASIAPENVFQSGTDNCGVVNLQGVSPSTFNCSDLGTRVVTLTVNDSHGNTNTCTATVTVADNIAPSVVCQNKTVYLNASGSASITMADVFLSAWDNCGTINQQSVLPNTFSCSDWGPNTVIFTVNDGHGNTSTCTATVTVADNIAPTVICKSYIANLNATGSASISTSNVFQSGEDNCGVVNQVTVSPNTFNCSNLGVNTVTLTVNDGHGNTNTCTSSVTVADTIAPTLLCKNVTLNLDVNGQATLAVAQVNNGSTDNCSIVVMALSQTAFSCSNIGTNNVTLIGRDPSNNQGQCIAIVTVRDPIVPVAKCKNFTANLGSNGMVTVAESSVNNGSTDNCSFTLTLTPNTFNCGQVGANAVTMKATDAFGNTATCLATVTIKDVTAPTALCKNATIYLNDAGQATLSSNDLNNGSSDACGISTMNLSKTQFNCSDIPGSAQTVTLTLKDVNNNTSSCTAQVTVKDNLAPTAICENTTVQLGSNGKVTVYPADLADGSFDNCSVWSYSPTAKVYTTANIGNNNLTITVKDWSGNGSTCISVVTVKAYYGFRNSDNRSAEEVADTPTNLTVFPNPTMVETSVQFDLQEEQAFSIRVYDMSGRLAMKREGQGQKGENSISLNLSGFAAGVYVVDFQSEGMNEQKRLVVQK